MRVVVWLPSTHLTCYPFDEFQPGGRVLAKSPREGTESSLQGRAELTRIFSWWFCLFVSEEGSPLRNATQFLQLGVLLARRGAWHWQMATMYQLTLTFLSRLSSMHRPGVSPLGTASGKGRHYRGFLFVWVTPIVGQGTSSRPSCIVSMIYSRRSNWFYISAVKLPGVENTLVFWFLLCHTSPSHRLGEVWHERIEMLHTCSCALFLCTMFMCSVSMYPPHDPPLLLCAYCEVSVLWLCRRGEACAKDLNII